MDLDIQSEGREGGGGGVEGGRGAGGGGLVSFTGYIYNMLNRK